MYGVPQVAADLKEAIEDLIFTYNVDLTLHGIATSQCIASMSLTALLCLCSCRLCQIKLADCEEYLLQSR